MRNTSSTSSIPSHVAWCGMQLSWRRGTAAAGVNKRSRSQSFPFNESFSTSYFYSILEVWIVGPGTKIGSHSKYPLLCSMECNYCRYLRLLIAHFTFVSILHRAIALHTTAQVVLACPVPRTSFPSALFALCHVSLVCLAWPHLPEYSTS